VCFTGSTATAEKPLRSRDALSWATIPSFVMRPFMCHSGTVFSESGGFRKSRSRMEGSPAKSLPVIARTAATRVKAMRAGLVLAESIVGKM